MSHVDPQLSPMSEVDMGATHVVSEYQLLVREQSRALQHLTEKLVQRESAATDARSTMDTRSGGVSVFEPVRGSAVSTPIRSPTQANYSLVEELHSYNTTPAHSHEPARGVVSRTRGTVKRASSISRRPSRSLSGRRTKARDDSDVYGTKFGEAGRDPSRVSSPSAAVGQTIARLVRLLGKQEKELETLKTIRDLSEARRGFQSEASWLGLGTTTEVLYDTKETQNDDREVSFGLIIPEHTQSDMISSKGCETPPLNSTTRQFAPLTARGTSLARSPRVQSSVLQATGHDAEATGAGGGEDPCFSGSDAGMIFSDSGPAARKSLPFLTTADRDSTDNAGIGSAAARETSSLGLVSEVKRLERELRLAREEHAESMRVSTALLNEERGRQNLLEDGLRAELRESVAVLGQITAERDAALEDNAAKRREHESTQAELSVFRRDAAAALKQAALELQTADARAVSKIDAELEKERAKHALELETWKMRLRAELAQQAAEFNANAMAEAQQETARRDAKEEGLRAQAQKSERDLSQKLVAECERRLLERTEELQA
ncbi:unnamed protein product, partial [Amoebophrya sp. A25]|eukprot:GSA25T00005804001.1